MTSTAGPAPLPRPRPLGRARLRVMTAVDESGDEGRTVATLARQLGIHENSVRHHLTALESEGQVESTSEVTQRRGRPSLIYRTTPAGRQAASGTGGAASPELMDALLATAGSHPDFRRQAGEEWGRRIAGPAPGPTSGSAADPAADPASAPDDIRSTLGRVMTGQGFTSVEHGGNLELRTCPLLDRARADPESVCGLHASMLQGILGAWGVPGETILEPFGLPGGCRVVLRDVGS
ncbi:helix-turn-helix domain-containing protein [Citricoccus sp. NPDC055426]|uniref:helix-turn-helix transcriptional regulator n=1 Tax=Citricoccus sp. NPDC055426 TaxID=3155536 RepID=UPI003446B222